SISMSEDIGNNSATSDSYSRNRKGAWAAVLGTAVAVCFVALVVYVLLKHKQQTSFSHKKLVEEYPTDPDIVQLDNIEPLDLDFGPVAYYNPALQGDNIQMLDIPGRL
uniref:Uncharacterized protein n=1 Tax=Mola mola TaxID=94237 RepID=A0A3Q3W933_MOLML